MRPDKWTKKTKGLKNTLQNELNKKQVYIIKHQGNWSNQEVHKGNVNAETMGPNESQNKSVKILR